jgi:PsbP-like protein
MLWLLRSFGNAEKSLVYDNNTYGISIQYPSSWESSPGEYNGSGGSSIDVATFSPTSEMNSSAIIDLLVDTVDPGQNLKQYVSDTISDNKAVLKDFKVLKFSIGNITLAGVPAYKIVYTYADAVQGT